MSLVNWVELRENSDDRGALIAIEGRKTVPFDIKRVYYIYGTKEDVERGFHAHRTLLQLAICVSGSCCITLDDGVNRAEVCLQKPNLGILIKEMVWREMRTFSKDCVLLVMASEYYNESDYIRSYSDFRRMIEQFQKGQI